MLNLFLLQWSSYQLIFENLDWLLNSKQHMITPFCNFICIIGEEHDLDAEHSKFF